ncbi:MAG: GatB/YqeY domain-containing protein [Candidatus Staskawiczbacteria bacterium]|nr:GatB/YqeY domain-containing protein [Candidatus Staskawiczbacteria bacterium]
MLKQQIQSDAISAMKEGKKDVSEILRMVLSNINAKEKEKRYKISKDLPAHAGEPSLLEEDLSKKSELSEDELISAVSSEIKKRKDAIVLYEKGERPELAEKEKKEIEIIQKYLPEQLSGDDLIKLVEESVANVGAKEIKDMGKVMADLNPKIKGKADGGEVSKIVKEFLVK